MGFWSGVIVGGVGVGIINYLIVRGNNRGQLIIDAMKYSWKLVEKVRPEGAKEAVEIYEKGDKDEFIGIFKELARAVLDKYSMWC